MKLIRHCMLWFSRLEFMRQLINFAFEPVKIIRLIIYSKHLGILCGVKSKHIEQVGLVDMM